MVVVLARTPLSPFAVLASAIVAMTGTTYVGTASAASGLLPPMQKNLAHHARVQSSSVCGADGRDAGCIGGVACIPCASVCIYGMESESDGDDDFGDDFRPGFGDDDDDDDDDNSWRNDDTDDGWTWPETDDDDDDDDDDAPPDEIETTFFPPEPDLPTTEGPLTTTYTTTETSTQTTSQSSSQTTSATTSQTTSVTTTPIQCCLGREEIVASLPDLSIGFGNSYATKVSWDESATCACQGRGRCCNSTSAFRQGLDGANDGSAGPIPTTTRAATSTEPADPFAPPNPFNDDFMGGGGMMDDDDDDSGGGNDACNARVVDAEAHLPSHATDGDESTFWMSKPGDSHAALTIDLGASKEIKQIEILFVEARPATMVLEKWTGGVTGWEPFQLYSDNCQADFGKVADAPPTESTSAACVSFQQFDANSGGWVSFSTLAANRPPTEAEGRDYRTDDGLHSFTRARGIRLRMTRFVKDTYSGSVGFGAPAASLASNFYAIAEVVVEGRCECFGHASECTDGEASTCDCGHSTAGDACDRCLPLYNHRGFARGIPASPQDTSDLGNAHECAECNCNGHADRCDFDTSLSTPAAVCTCMNGTTGTSCQDCALGFFRPIDADLSTPCTPCECAEAGSILHDDVALPCHQETGQCKCRSHTAGRQCNECQQGFYELDAAHDGGCRDCDCALAGVENATMAGVCDPEDGCYCKESNTGEQCTDCAHGYYHPAASSSSDGSGDDDSSNADGASAFGRGVCHECHSECDGCIAYGATLGSACSSCKNHRLDVGGGDGTQCLSERDCPIQTHGIRATLGANGRQNASYCVECHSSCGSAAMAGRRRCTGPTSSDCISCAVLRAASGACVDDCPLGEYAGGGQTCRRCNSQCRGGCTGPSNTDCNSCMNHTEVVTGACVDGCDDWSQYTVVDPSTSSVQCADCSDRCEGGCTGSTDAECTGCTSDLVRLEFVENDAPAGDGAEGSRGSSTAAPQCALSCDANEFRATFNETLLRETAAAAAAADQSAGGAAVEPWVGNVPYANEMCARCDPACGARCSAAGASLGACRGQCRVARFNDKCVESCPAHTFAAGDTDTVCAECSPYCLQQGGCTGPTPDLCLGGCAQNAVLVYHSTEGGGSQQTPENEASLTYTCSPGCPAGFFADDKGVCRACIAGCLRCSGRKQKHCQMCMHYTLNEPGRGCTDVCDPSAMSLHAETVTFASSSNVSVLQSGDSIVCRACAAGTYPAGDFACKACHNQCAESCIGPGADECSVGVGDDPSSSHGCVGLHEEGTCVASCSDGFYKVSGGSGGSGTCERCNGACQTCSGPTSADCQSCNICDKKTKTGDCPCVTSCPAGKYPESASNSKSQFECEECSNLCGAGGCIGNGAHQCIGTCAVAWFDGACVDDCPTGTWIDPSRKCLPCHQECNRDGGCSGPMSSQCDSCENVMREGQCSKSCAANEYAAALVEDGTDDGAKQCAVCAAQCGAEGCQGPTSSVADCNGVCAGVQLDGECLDACPTGHVVDSLDDGNGGVGRTCVPCHEQCADGCHGPAADECTRCVGPQYASVCVATCPALHYESDPAGARICIRCNKECREGCTGPRPYDCSPFNACTNFFDVTDARCASKCSLSSYVAENECVASCPPELPYSADPAVSAAVAAGEPRACVARCSDLNETGLGHVVNSDPYSCTTEMAAADRVASTGTIAWEMPAVVLGAVVVILAIFAFISHTKAKRGEWSPGSAVYAESGFPSPMTIDNGAGAYAMTPMQQRSPSIFPGPRVPATPASAHLEGLHGESTHL